MRKNLKNNQNNDIKNKNNKPQINTTTKNTQSTNKTTIKKIELQPVNKEQTIINEPTERDPQDIFKSQIKKELKAEIRDILKSQIKKEIINEMKNEQPESKIETEIINKVEEVETKLEDKPKKATINFYDNTENEKNTAIVEWDIEEPAKYDRIGLYQHDRMHDSNYIQIIDINGAQNGKHTFTNLVNGYYDVRLLNWKTRYDNIEPAVCCVGEKVDIYVDMPDKYPPVLNIYIPTKSILNEYDYIAIFNKDENSNKTNKSVLLEYMHNAKDVNIEENKEILNKLVGNDKMEKLNKEDNKSLFKLISFNLHNIIGEFSIKYFYYDSTSMFKGNVFSGFNTIKIDNYDNISINLNKDDKNIKIYWRLYTIAPNSNQWIGIYNDEDKLIHYEYVCDHVYTDETRTEGVITIENNDFIKDFFDNYINLDKINNWKVKFMCKGLFTSYMFMNISLIQN